jgi:hypothetical protein
MRLGARVKSRANQTASLRSAARRGTIHRALCLAGLLPHKAAKADACQMGVC